MAPIGTSCRLVTGMRRKRRTSRNDGLFEQHRVYLLRSTCQPRPACIECANPLSTQGSPEATGVPHPLEQPAIMSADWRVFNLRPRYSGGVSDRLGSAGQLSVWTDSATCGSAARGVTGVQGAGIQTAMRLRSRDVDVVFLLRHLLRRPECTEAHFRETAACGASFPTPQNSANGPAERVGANRGDSLLSSDRRDQ